MIFRTKNPETTKKAPKNALDTLWSAYWIAKEEVKAKQIELAGLEEQILAESQKQSLFKGQTATHGTNKISYTDRQHLIVPKNFDFDKFGQDFPQLCKVGVDSTKIAKLLTDADERNCLHDYHLEVELVRNYTFKKG